jgi:hypothetical protein
LNQITPLGSRHFALVRDRFLAKSDRLKDAARKFVHEDIDPLVALRNVFEAENAYIVCGYLVVYNITEMWWSDSPILAEQLVFALEPESSFDAVINFLEDKAREAGAKYLCVGTALAKSDNALASLYEKRGFSRMAINLAKEIV